MFGEYEPKGRKVHFEQATPLLKGHGDKSVMLLSFLMQLAQEKMMCIRFHMGAFETKDIDAYGDAVSKYENVLFAHTADMISARISEV